MSAAVLSHATPAALRPGPPGQPDITYAPDFEKYQTRVATRLSKGGLASTLPVGFPEELRGDLVWEGETLPETYDWTFVLNEEQLGEIEKALTHFKCLLPHWWTCVYRFGCRCVYLINTFRSLQR